MIKLLDFESLENSSIVANSLMNRRRKCFGGNSYEKELSFEILSFLKTRAKSEIQVRWLDVCCGEAQALIEAVKVLNAENIEITGIDLAGIFAENSTNKTLKLIETSFENFDSDDEFDLITCVHGLHYIGDKLAFLQKSVALLKPDGIFLANLDLNNLKFADNKSSSRKFGDSLRKNGFDFDSRKHILQFKGKKQLNFDFKYLGADDQAGANYTKQAVVDSYYSKI